MGNGKDANTLLVHIEHSKPIEVKDFVTSLNAIETLFSCFVQKNGDNKELTQAKLYVEKIEEGCIDIFLREMVTPTLIPFMENMNVILQFSSYLKDVLGYFTRGIGKKPDLSVQESKSLKDMLAIPVGDEKGSMTIGAINNADKVVILNGSTFNFFDSNSAQNQLSRLIEEGKRPLPSDEIHCRQLMRIYQMRSDLNTDTGNKAIIDTLSDKKLGVVFETDELKRRILHSDDNPAKKAFLVDVVVMTVNGKMIAYKVVDLHDVVDLEDN